MKKTIISILTVLALTVFSYTTAGAQVLINEVDADQTGTDSSEFVELYNAGGSSVDMGAGSYVLVHVNGSDLLSYDAVDITGSVAAGDFFVIGVTAVANVDLDAQLGGFWGATNAIQNGADGFVLLTGTTASAYPTDTDTLTGAGTAIDGVAYDTNDSDNAGLLAACFITGQPQINEAFNDSTVESIQRIGDGAGGAFNTGSYQVAPPTPGTGNAVPVELSTFSIN